MTWRRREDAGEHPTARRFRGEGVGEYVAAALLFATVSVVALQQQRVTILRYIDSDEYYWVAYDFATGAKVSASAPFVWRILTPWLVSFSAPVDIARGTPFYVINIASGLGITLLMVPWLRAFVATRWVRTLAILAFLAEWHAPARFVYYQPMYVDPLFMLCLLAALLVIERTRERPVREIAWPLAVLSFVGTLDREVMLLAPMAFAVARLRGGDSPLKPAVLGWLGIPLGASVAALWLSHAVVTPSEGYAPWAVPLQMLKDKPAYTWLLGWFFTFGPSVLAVIAANGGDTWRWLRAWPEWAFLLVGVGALGYVAGTDTERILIWSFPVVYAAFGRAVERLHPALRRPSIAFVLLLVQAVSARVFWEIPSPTYNPGRFIELRTWGDQLHAALNRTIVMDSDHGNLWSFWGSRRWHLVLVLYDLVFMAVMVAWIRRASNASGAGRNSLRSTSTLLGRRIRHTRTQRRR